MPRDKDLGFVERVLKGERGFDYEFQAGALRFMKAFNICQSRYLQSNSSS